MKRLSRHLFAALLWLYPPSFRREFGGELLALFDEALEHRASAWLTWTACLDVARAAAAEHLSQHMEVAMTPKRITGWLLLLAALLNVTYDAVSETAAMGPPAILLTAVAAAAGTVLVREGKRLPRTN